MSTKAGQLPWLYSLPVTLGWIWAASALVVAILVARDCVRERRRPEGYEALFIALGPVTLAAETYLRFFDRDDEGAGR
jgi:hypothetical protein